MTGSIIRDDYDFTFTAEAGNVSPNSINYIFFTVGGAAIDATSTPNSGSPTSWDEQLDSDAAALASYAQVVGVQGGIGSSNVLTLNWYKTFTSCTI